MLGKAKNKIESEIESLKHKVEELQAIVEDMTIRLKALEEGYEPLFQYFLESKEKSNPKNAGYFMPSAVLHPNEDYAE